MKVSAKDACAGRWRGILPQVGVPASSLTGKQVPCPKCKGKDRFRFDDLDGRGTFYCNACGAGDGFQLVSLMTGMSNREACRRAVELAGGVNFEKPRPMIRSEDAYRAMLSLWRSSKPVTPQDDVGRYLGSRGIVLPPCDSLRYAPAVNVTGEDGYTTLPAMIARVRDACGDSVNIHRTYLLDGAKAPISAVRKLMSTGKVEKDTGCHIELCDAAAEMGVAEGIETALRASQRFAMPVWSAINTNYLEQFQPPAICRKLHIYGDADLKYGGQKAAYALAYRLVTRPSPIEVVVHIPGTLGKDWADD